MGSSIDGAVASSVDAPARLAPVLGALFAGVPSLGSSPRRIVRLLRDAGVGGGDRVLELACGKGTLAVLMARRLGVRVVGVDGHAPFVAEAARAAGRAGVADRVRFVLADVSRPVRGVRGSDFDAVLMIGLFALGRAARVLRRRTRAGGVYVVDDCFLDRSGGLVAPGLEDVPDLDSCRLEIESLGDRVERVQVPTPSAVRALNARLYRRLAANGARVGRDHPRLRPAIREFLARQRGANALLGGVLRPAVWVVRRGAGSR